MTDTDPGRTEHARQLSAEAQHLYGVTKRRKEALRAAEEHALAVAGTAESRDGSVRASVDAGGMLTGLVLTAEALRGEAAAVAGLVTAVTQQAAARARTAVREVFEPLRNEGVLRAVPVLLPAPEPEAPTRPPRKAAEEEASFEERSITRRRR